MILVSSDEISGVKPTHIKWLYELRLYLCALVYIIIDIVFFRSKNR